MATDPMLQWQSHITDSTDRDTIISNVGVLEQFAGAITGDDSLKEKFEQIRTGIKDGTIKPTEWQTSAPFVQITSKLKESSSGKIDGLDGRLKTAEDDISSHTTKLDEQKQTLTDQGNRLTTAEGSITSHEETISGYGTRITNAEDDIKKKLGISEFEKFQTGDTSWKDKMDKKVKSFASSSELDDLRTLLSNEISHWTRAKAPQPLDSYKALADLKKFEQPWEVGANADKNYIPERHIGDLCTVIGATQPDKGVSYRFIKHASNNTYTWTKVIDNDGAKALSQHSQFVTQYEERQNKLDEDSKNKQSSIDALKKRLGFSDTDTDKSVKELLEEERQERKKIYKVTVTTKGYIKDGKIVDGTTIDGKPVIVHTAHVYTLTGESVTNNIAEKLTWTINKGRTTKPVEKTVTGLVCEVSQDQFVNDGTNPYYYNIELNSTF